VQNQAREDVIERAAGEGQGIASSGTQIRQGRTGDDTADTPVVVTFDQTLGEVVQVGEVAESGPQKRQSTR
jgi:hypothetical protein